MSVAPLRHFLAFLESDRHDAAGDFRTDGDRLVRAQCADSLHRPLDGAENDRRDLDDRRRHLKLTTRLSRAALVMFEPEQPGAAERKQNRGSDPGFHLGAKSEKGGIICSKHVN